MSAERIRRFLDEYGTLDFREARLDESLRALFRTRAQAAAIHSPIREPNIEEDLRTLCFELESARDQPLRIWSIDLPSGRCFLVFELLEDHRIAGCVKSRDQRVPQEG